MTAPPAGSRAVDVLIAEDDALMRQSLRTLLEMEGYRCEEADDGRTAVEMARRRCRGAPSWTWRCREWMAARRPVSCADPRTRGIHIHCLTGITDSSARKRAEQAGFETYMTKPVDASQLLGVIRREMKEPVVVEASGLSLAEARDVLDYWENAGYQDLEASHEEGKGFIVRGVRPARGQ